MEELNNIVFIDGQNLHLSTTQDNWKINLIKFKIYLEQKYKIKQAYYFLGYMSDHNIDLYSNLKLAGFIVVFKEHNINSIGKKKGNVDSDIIFEMMKSIIDIENLNKILLVSGDGDYKKVVDYLILKNKFGKILFPNRKFRSSLYKTLGNNFCVYLDDIDIKGKIAYTK